MRTLNRHIVSLRNFPSAKKRREYLESELQIDLSHLKSISLEENPSVYCENIIGSAQIPMGVAGPLLILNNKKSKSIFIPLATTEGALVASVSRGCKALSQSGGVIVNAELRGQTRGPVFYTESVENGLILKKWIEKNFTLLSKTANTTSNHIEFIGTRVKIIGANTFVKFIFNTSDAMGMNMVTIAVEKMAELIEEKKGYKCIAVAGNFDIDKKPSFMNIIDGRGFEVWAECIIPKKILKETLKTTASSLYETWLAKCMVGSYASGALGYNAHFANIIAALFIATGQDPAHVVEGSTGIVICEERGDNLYISINMPSLLVGTVGGGTILPTQKSALSIMGIDKKVSSIEFAKLIGGVVLAGELSLLSALASGALGKSHKELGRKKV